MDKELKKISFGLTVPIKELESDEVRDEYCSNVRNFYNGTFKDILEELRFDALKQLLETGNSRDADFILKANIKALDDIEKWFVDTSKEISN